MEWRWVVSVREREERRASFSGLGGIGGAGREGVSVGKGVSKGDERRSAGGGGFDEG